EIKTLMSQAQQARKMAAATGDKDKAETLNLKAETFEQKAGMLMDGVKQLQTLEVQTHDMLDKFRHWSRVSDAKIDRTAMKVEFYAEQRAMILDAQKTLGVGMKLLRGNPEQLKAALSGASAPITMPTGSVLGRGVGAGSAPTGSQGSGDYNELFKS